MNRLAREKSPYLLKHADNPVDWYPWCEEAFEKAMKEDKPIFLSIGYSSCHWCNVMEKESFQDEEVANLLNETFVCIKVDREERPDIDNLYMTFCQMMTGSGGWPLNIIMTPDRKPFFAATYIPKESRLGLPGFVELVPRIRELWKTKRGDLTKQGEQLIHELKRYISLSPEESIGREDADAAFEQLLASYDESHGGFGGAPKFPAPHRLMFLLRYWKLSGDKSALIMVEKTLQKMRRGGVYDQLGFGFHRYSTDAYWLVPHFEKMLYDQALALISYVEAYQATGKDEYIETASEIAEYVLRELSSPEGGFYSSEDADSEGVEGKYYLWSEEQMKSCLDEKEFEIASRVFLGKMKVGAEGEGYVLHLAEEPEDIAKETGMSESEVKRMIDGIRKKMLDERSRRVRPAKDDKILTDWNGLMIAALSKLFTATGRKEYLARARAAVDFLLKRMKGEDGTLLHRYRDGDASIDGLLEDYAYLCWGLLELYEASFEVSYLKDALELKEQAVKRLWDNEKGGFFQSDADDVIYRIKEAQDGAMPSGNSVMCLVLFLLARVTGNVDDERKVEEIKKIFSSSVRYSPAQHSFLILSSVLIPAGFHEVVISMPEDADEIPIEFRKKFIPNKFVLLRRERDGVSELDEVVPLAKDYSVRNGKTTYYVCTNFACNAPTNSIEEAIKMLN